MGSGFGRVSHSHAGINLSPWWRHQMETFSALVALYAGNSPVTGEFPAQRPVMRIFDVSLDLRLNKRLSKQSSGWWFQTPSHSLWRHRNGHIILEELEVHPSHYNDVIISAMASQITRNSTAYSTVCSGWHERKHRNSRYWPFVRGIDRWPVDSLHKTLVTRRVIWWHVTCWTDLVQWSFLDPFWAW